MWYFAWLLGLPLAAMFAVVNAMWLELQEDSRMINDQGRTGKTGSAHR
ncbi:cytochrome bd-I oxidase subunit CydX [Hoeflea sp.]